MKFQSHDHRNYNYKNTDNDYAYILPISGLQLAANLVDNTEQVYNRTSTIDTDIFLKCQKYVWHGHQF